MSLGQYFQHYAESEIFQISDLDYYYENILTIPVFNEPESLISRLKDIQTEQSLLIILVLNAPDSLAHEQNQEAQPALIATQALGKKIKQTCPLLQTFTSTINLLALDTSPSRHILLIERCHKDNLIPEKEGVGLARKIACDIACKIIASGHINSPWIHNTDADVKLPEKYFHANKTLNPEEVVAALYPFEHVPSQDQHLNLCQGLYDLSLHYYVAGLSWANSPYAFHTVGSTLLINFHAYGIVRGFPKRAAGEDFYLLNKMAKTGEIVSLEAPVIQIDCRKSDRVPFGTGPALSKIAALAKPLEEYFYYNPLCFEYLKTWLILLPFLFEEKVEELNLPLLEKIQKNIEMKNQKINLEYLLDCLIGIGTNKALLHGLQNSRTPENFQRHMHNWFDAFRTLKFIHYMRDSLTRVGHPSVTKLTLLEQADFFTNRHQL